MQQLHKLFSSGLMLTTLLLSSGMAASQAFGADTSAPGQGPISLQDTINATLRTHKTLKSIQENREVVSHELDRAWRGYGPRIDVSGAAGFGQLSNPTNRALREDTGFGSANRVGVTLVQPLWDGLATRSRVRNAQSTVDSVTNRVFDNATSLSLDAIIAHIDVLRRREILTLAQANVDRHEQILGQARDRERMGADTRADVTQAESRLARAQSTLVDARASTKQGEDTYVRLTGLRPNNLLPVSMMADFYTDPAQIIEEARRSNPKLLAYINDIKATQANKELAQSAFHPLINLEAGPNYSDREGRGSQWIYSFDVMATLRWNIFNSGQDVAEVKASEARVRQARQFMYNFMDDTALEVENTWTSYLSAQEQYKHYMDAVGFNTITRDAYQEQFVTGQRSLLDVLDAESELFNSATQSVTARDNVLVAAYRLLADAGVLLPKLEIPTEGLYKRPEDAPKEPREQF